MKPFYVLLTAFVISLLVIKIIGHSFNYKLAGCIAMSGMLLFTGIAHFKYTKGMALMVPDFMPVKEAWVYFTGRYRNCSSNRFCSCHHSKPLLRGCLFCFFVLILPANIHATIKHIDYEKSKRSWQRNQLFVVQDSASIVIYWLGLLLRDQINSSINF